MTETTRTENLLTLADAVAEAGDMKEAEGHYTRVLEHDIGSWRAWAGKGWAAGTQSAPSSLRVKEMVGCFEKAIQASGGDLDEAKRLCLTRGTAVLNVEERQLRGAWGGGVGNYRLIDYMRDSMTLASCRSRLGKVAGDRRLEREAVSGLDRLRAESRTVMPASLQAQWLEFRNDLAKQIDVSPAAPETLPSGWKFLAVIAAIIGGLLLLVSVLALLAAL